MDFQTVTCPPLCPPEKNRFPWLFVAVSGRLARNCSVEPWSGPPACSPSMAAEQPTRYPSSTPMRTGAASGHATHGFGPIRSLRLPRDRTSRLAITLSWPVIGRSCLRVSWLKGETDSTGLDRCGEDAHRPLFHTLTEQLRWPGPNGDHAPVPRGRAVRCRGRQFRFPHRRRDLCP